MSGNKLPNLKPLPFVAVAKAVMRGSKCEAITFSRTMAERVAAALNAYKPGSRGK